MSPDILRMFDEFSESVADFVGRANRTTLKCTLFDALRRTEVTLPAYTTLVPAFLRSVGANTPPESLGKALRAVACRPNPMHLAGAAWQCLLERERRLALELPQQPPEDLAWTLDYVGRALRATRADDSSFPCNRNGWHMRILDEADVSRLVQQAEPLSGALISRLRRLSASLELYSFMLHGEHRDGSFDHGPYAHKDRKVVFKDFTDLQSTFLPWAKPETHLSHPAISILLVLDAHCVPEFNWAGTMTCTSEVYDHLKAAAVFSVINGDVRPLTADLWESLEREARAAQRRIFTMATSWSPAERIKYGSWLFTNHLQEIPRLLGLDPGITRQLVAEFGELVEQEYALLDLAHASPVWAALRRPQPFTQIA